MPYRLIQHFEAAFNRKHYIHRNQAVSTNMAAEFYDDLYECRLSQLYNQRIDGRERVLSITHQAIGIPMRRGDAALGPLVHGQAFETAPGSAVARGPIASVEIGIEVKIVAKAMVKQIDRVVSDLRRQVEQFREQGDRALSIGIVGINWALEYTSYEGDRSYKTDGRSNNRHPFQEAATVIDRLQRDAAPAFSEFLILEFLATNEPPYPFQWRNAGRIDLLYGAALTRIAQQYQSRFL